ncbi:hypothetical protein PRUPE_4G278100 [Prunus persica]|uniref:Uncharacterized protein n=1 Tax=Prunus persica TaxID=3760 RepID=A0A251PS43_PRUPE|nr:hypothetical protein PRUPE_4G278100 [Prunus persica]
MFDFLPSKEDSEVLVVLQMKWCSILKISILKQQTVKGLDAAFIGPNENQFAVLYDDKIGLVFIYFA